MNVNDLRTVLRERADTVVDHDAEERVGRVHGRVRGARRRRVAGVTVGVLVLVGAVSVLPNRGSGPPDTVGHKNFVSHSGEFDLIAAEVGGRGQNVLDVTVPAHRGEVLVEMVCYGVPGPIAGYWVSGYVGGLRPTRPHSEWCGDDPDTPAVPGVSGAAPGPWQYGGLRLPPADGPVTVRVELTQEVDGNGRVVDSPDDVGTYARVFFPDVAIGVAVYAVAEPVATVAGTEVRPLVGLAGQDYSYVANRVSRSGEQTLTWTLEPSAEVRYYDVVAMGPAGPGVVASLDGTSCRADYALSQFRAGGCLLSPGEPHTITVTIDGVPPASAVLGIVLYRQG